MGIRHFPGKADANGKILNAAPRCFGFMLAPGIPSVKENAGNNVLMPGSFPVRVKPRGSGEIIGVRNSHAFYFGEEFPSFDILDCDAGDCWDVFTFDTREDGIMLASAKTLIPVRIQGATAVPTASPALATDGFAMRPGMKSFTAYWSGTARVNRLWVLPTAGGTWFDTGVDYDQTATTQRFDNFVIGVNGDRFAFVASGAAQSVALDANMEVG